MARRIFTLNQSLTDEQITAMYDLSEELHVVIGLWGNTPSPARDSFTWSISGGPLQRARFMRRLKTLL
ncbi:MULTISPECIES: hypothetical protein [unclassified Streptomyces]|uniref:hypothetical protein n=1 Tax=unclassified Streptomyces TaxID=2593676 RepID=UPI0035D885DA